MSTISTITKVILITTALCSISMAEEVVVPNKGIDIFAATKYEGYKEIITLDKLIGSGADINATNDEGLSLIHLAAKYNPNPEVIKLLVRYGADVNTIAGIKSNDIGDKLSGTPLYYALCYNTNIKVTELLLELQQQDKRYPVYNLMKYAVRNPNEEVVEIFECKLVNELFLKAAVNPNTAVMEKFRTVGANINDKYRDGQTSPLYEAVKANNMNGVKYLVFAGAYMEAKYEGRKSVLLAAASNEMNYNTSRIVSFLVNYGCYINDIDEHGNTALHLAVQRATSLYKQEYASYPLSVIKELVDNYANPAIENFAGETPLEYAKKHLKNEEGGVNLSDEVIQVLEQAEIDTKRRLLEMQACG